MTMFSSLLWYTPAEARQGWSDVLASALAGRIDLEGAITAYTGQAHCALAGEARALLYLLLQHLHSVDANARNEVLVPVQLDQKFLAVLTMLDQVSLNCLERIDVRAASVPVLTRLPDCS